MQSSNVLVVAHAQATGLDIGADFVSTFDEARAHLARFKPAVLVFGGKGRALEEFCAHTAKASPDSLWIVAGRDVAPETIMRWTNAGKLHDLIDDFDDPGLEEKLRSALEASGEAGQRRQLVELFEDQSERHKRLSSDLETRVQKRLKSLRKSLATLEETKSRMEVFHEALLGINSASTVLQMEQVLNGALNGAIDVAWVRVRFANQSSLKANGPHVFSVDLGGSPGGEVMFAKANGKRFTTDEQDFLQELSEALSLALARMHKLEQAETVKAQWQATFDAIPHALSVVAGEFEILKLNRAFLEASNGHGEFRDLIGKSCFDVFFGPDYRPPAPLECPFTFRQPRAQRHFEVTGQRIGVGFDSPAVQLILLREITEEVRFERRIFEGSKLAELGTIGSSIAHELNNPLGGMLSFLQLILMDMKKDDPLHPEIKAMEEATLRCRDIVLNLLSFARKQDLGEFTEVDLWDVVGRAVKLIELQSKSMGIELRLKRGPRAVVKGSSNALSQALCNVLQNAIDAIAERLKEHPLYPGAIVIEIETSAGNHLVKISDNGTGIRPEVQSQIFNPLYTTRDNRAGMGLTTAFTIVSEHHGSLEILSQTGSGTSAIFSLPRLDILPD